jgi:hypothetical protein
VNSQDFARFIARPVDGGFQVSDEHSRSPLSLAENEKGRANSTVSAI